MVDSALERAPGDGPSRNPNSARRAPDLRRRTIATGREPAVTIAPHVDSRIWPAGRLKDFDRAAKRLTTAALGAMLRCNLALGHQFDQFAGLSDLSHQRLLAINVLAGLHEGHAERRMPARAGGNQYGVQRLFGFEQLTVIFVKVGLLGGWLILGGLVGTSFAARSSWV